MKNIARSRIYALLILFFLYLFIVSFPFSRFIDNSYVIYGLEIGLRIFYIAFFFYYTKREYLPLVHFNKPKLKSLYFIPFFLICFSNFFVYLFYKDYSGYSISWNKTYILEIVLLIASVVVEELLYRGLILPILNEKYNNITSILISAALFGLTHLLNITSFASIPTCLIQALYTFGLGLVLAFTYLYSGNFIFPVIFHLAFNFLNGQYAGLLFYTSATYEYYIINAIVALIILIYASLIYTFVFKKEEY